MEPMDRLLYNALISVVFAVLGFVLLFLGYRLFDALTPGHLGQRIIDDGNMAAALLAGAFVVALAIVVHAAIT
jgi:uncharacterized membrane protein YjfL (UPF0719 family)